MTEPPQPRRRRFTLSLRALMVLVLIIGGVLGWKVRRATIQRRAVATIDAAGWVWYDYQNQVQSDGSPGINDSAEPWAPGWLRRPIGDEYFQEVAGVLLHAVEPEIQARLGNSMFPAVAALDRVEAVESNGYPLNDSDFALLLTLPRLRRLALVDADVTDSGLESLAASHSLECFELSSKPGLITGRGVEAIARQTRLKRLLLASVDLTDPATLAPLGKLTRLEDLELYDTPEDNRFLADFRGLKSLRKLILNNTQLTDEGAELLAGLDHLERLWLDGSKLTDAGLSRLASHNRLEDLTLDPAPLITDAGLVSLESLGSLICLDLTNTKLTDAGLLHLKGMKLQSLTISGEGVTDAGLATLQQIKSLRYLHISGKISQKAIDAFHNARPEVKLGYDPTRIIPNSR